MWLFKDKNVVRHRILSILSQEYEALVTTKKEALIKRTSLQYFQHCVSLFNRLESQFLNQFFVAFGFHEHVCSEITRLCLQRTNAIVTTG